MSNEFELFHFDTPTTKTLQAMIEILNQFPSLFSALKDVGIDTKEMEKKTLHYIKSMGGIIEEYGRNT